MREVLSIGKLPNLILITTSKRNLLSPHNDSYRIGVKFEESYVSKIGYLSNIKTTSF